MRKKYGTKKGKEKQIPERELIGGEFYLIDEKKCLYKSIEDDSIYYNAEGKGLFLRTLARIFVVLVERDLIVHLREIRNCLIPPK